MRFYAFSEFDDDVKILAKEIKQDFNPDALIAIARGGMTLGHSLSIALNTRRLFSLNSIHYDNTKKLDTIEVFNIPDLTGFKRIVLVDDIVDSGESITEIKKIILKKYPEIEIRVAVLFYKTQAIFEPEYKIHHADEWVEFFWDIKI